MRSLLILFLLPGLQPGKGQTGDKVGDIVLPAGYKRCPEGADSFGTWLRQIQLKKDKTVYLYNGQRKANQSAQYAVLQIPTGEKDLQQCADAVMRMRAEYLYSKKAYGQIAFHATDGTLMDYDSWRKGYRFFARRPLSNPGEGRASFERYLETVFSYAGTISLSKELISVTVESIQPGDVFIKSGSPGHAVIVVDVAYDKYGKKIFMLAQSYMPAQNVHILKNPLDGRSAWYSTDFGSELTTPEWTFKRSELKRFK